MEYFKEIRCSKCNKKLGQLRNNKITTTNKTIIESASGKFMITCMKCRTIRIINLKSDK